MPDEKDLNSNTDNGNASDAHPQPPCEFGQSGSLSKSGYYARGGGKLYSSADSPRHRLTDWTSSSLDIKHTDLENHRDETPKYRLEEKLHEGGMGAVYRAFDRDIRRNVALKMSSGDNPRTHLRLIEEAQVTGQLEHPNIVPIHELGVNADGRLYFTMKLVEGRSLKEVIQQLRDNPDEPPPPEYSRNSLLLAFMNVCHAMAFAHSRGVVHRDLKPANIMLGKYGEVLIVDWGLAKPCKNSSHLPEKPLGLSLTADSPTDDTVSSLREDTGVDITMDGMIVGTPAYMAPEQADGRVNDVDEITDIYALGAILYEIITLQRPVDGKNFNELLANIICGFITPPEKVVQDIPRELSAITLKAMANKKEDRYQSAEEFRRDIQLFLEGRTVSAKEDSAWDTIVKLVKRNKIASISAAVIFALILISLVINVRERRFAEESFAKYKSEQKAREALIAKDYYERQRTWVKVFEDDFSDPNVEDRWNVVYVGYHLKDGNKKWTLLPPDMKVRDGELFIQGGSPRALFLKQPISGDCAIEFECRQDSAHMNDISCFIGARRGADPIILPYSGYLFQFGGYDNTRVILQSDGENLHQEFGSFIQRGKTHHVRAERIGERLLFIVNGDTIYDIREEIPLFGIDRDAVGLYGWAAPAVYDNVKVYEMGVPVKDDLVEIARRQLLEGNYTTAENLYAEIARSSVDSAHRQMGAQGVDRAKNLARLRARLPEYRRKLDRAYGPKVTDLEIVEDGLGLDFNESEQITTLTPISDLPIVQLRARWQRQLTSLEPISNLSLRSLDIFGCMSVSDLWPVASMPLERLHMSVTAINDLTPVTGLPLTIFLATNCGIRSIEPLRGKKLDFVVIRSNEITDLSPLKGAPLSRLRADANDIADIACLAGAPLKVLGLNHNRKLTDLSPLANAPLKDLRIRNTGVSDLGFLQGASLVNLLADGCPIEDVSVLSGIGLKYLSLKDTRAASIENIRVQSLERIFLDHTRVTSLAPLRGSPVSVLGAYGIPLTDENTEIIRSLPLRRLTIDLREPGAEALVRELKDLQYVNGHRYEYVLKVLDILNNSDPRETGTRLREIAFAKGDKQWLPMPLRVTAQEANEMCSAFGGHLFVLQDSEMREMMTQIEKVVAAGISGQRYRFHIGLEYNEKTGQYGWTEDSSNPNACWKSTFERLGAQKTRYAVFDCHTSPQRIAADSTDHAYFVIEWDKN